MKITVCEFPDEAGRHEAPWTDLTRFLRAHPTDVVVLPEMPLCDWQMFMTRTIDPAAWKAALAAPFLTTEIDLEDAVRAKSTYPRNLAGP